MFKRRITGCLVAETPDEIERESEACASAMSGYYAFLESADLSDAGDLLEFFGLGFFHDATIEHLAIASDAKTVSFDAHAWVEDWPEDPVLSVEFFDVASVGVRRHDNGAGGLEFLYSEIDGLDEPIACARQAFGGAFHSLTIECDEAWITLVFRSVSVTARDSAAWMLLTADPNARLALWSRSDGL